MEISNLSVHSGGVGNLDRWALVQFANQTREQRTQHRERVHDNLSELLFGVDLHPDELRLYRARLMEAISRVESLENAMKLELPKQMSVSRSNLMLKVGNVAWIPPKNITKSLDLTPAHEIHSRNLAKNLKTLLSLNPKSIRSDFHTVGIVVAQGSEGMRIGEDKVELSHWGIQAINAKDSPKIASLRLPPRFPSHCEMIQFRAS